MKRKTEKRRKDYWLFRILRGLVWLFSPKFQIYGLENLPEEPCIIAGNHSHMYGPIAGELYFPGKLKIWCNHEMMYLKEVPAYTFYDMWAHKPHWWTWPFCKILSYLIAPLSVCLFRNAKTIPVYRDNRIITTFRKTVESLSDGENIIIFPEHYTPRNNIIYDFQNRFIDVAKLYYKRTGKALSFVPMYIAPKLKSIYLGEPVPFDPEQPMDTERERISEELMVRITDIGTSLPLHTVIPYPNVSKKHYPKNKEG